MQPPWMIVIQPDPTAHDLSISKEADCNLIRIREHGVEIDLSATSVEKYVEAMQTLENITVQAADLRSLK